MSQGNYGGGYTPPNPSNPYANVGTFGQATPPNFEAAQQMIDILGILEEKTKGNLTAEERQLLEQGLYELRMRFFEVKKDGGPRIIVP